MEVNQMGEWISVEEKVPGLEYVGLKVIVCIKRRYDKPRTDVLRWWASAETELWQDVTHWVPLPQPPKEE